MVIVRIDAHLLIEDFVNRVRVVYHPDEIAEDVREETSKGTYKNDAPVLDWY